MTGDELWRAGRSLAESRVAFRSDELTETTHLKRAIFLDGFVEGYLAAMHDVDERNPFEGRQCKVIPDELAELY